MQKGFTLIELIVTIAIVSALSLVIVFSVAQYANKGRDSNIYGNLAVLVPAGESYYNVENALHGDGYSGFCQSSAVTAIYPQLAIPTSPNACGDDEDHPGFCCTVAGDGDEWAACAQEFEIPTQAFCVDSRGAKRHICQTSCVSGLTECPVDTLATCN